jgi:hypothetical protein
MKSGWEMSLLDMIVRTVKLDPGRAVSPEGGTDGKEFLGPGVSLVVLEKVPVCMLLRGRTARDEIEGNATADQVRQRIHLLDKGRWFYQAGATGQDKPELFGALPQGAGNEKRVGFMAAEGNQDRLDPRLFSRTREPRPALQIGTARWRVLERLLDAVSGGGFRRLHCTLTGLGKHPMEP